MLPCVCFASNRSQIMSKCGKKFLEMEGKCENISHFVVIYMGVTFFSASSKIS